MERGGRKERTSNRIRTNRVGFAASDSCHSISNQFNRSRASKHVLYTSFDQVRKARISQRYPWLYVSSFASLDDVAWNHHNRFIQFTDGVIQINFFIFSCISPFATK